VRSAHPTSSENLAETIGRAAPAGTTAAAGRPIYLFENDKPW